jgi:hypothetical protein
MGGGGEAQLGGQQMDERARLDGMWKDKMGGGGEAQLGGQQMGGMQKPGGDELEKLRQMKMQQMQGQPANPSWQQAGGQMGGMQVNSLKPMPQPGRDSMLATAQPQMRLGQFINQQGR